MKFQRSLIAATVFVAAASTASLVMAQPVGDMTARVETRLAAAKAAIKITPAQEAAWSKYAGLMTQLAKTGEATRKDMLARRADGKQPSAEEWAKWRDTMIQQRTEHQAQRAVAVKDLYATLTPEQRATAEDYLPGARGGRGGRGHGMGGHGPMMGGHGMGGHGPMMGGHGMGGHGPMMGGQGGWGFGR